MTDIGYADDAKLKFRILCKMLSKKGDTKTAHDDLRSCSNIIFREIYMELMLDASKIKMKHQRSVIADNGAWLLWNIYKDTAYNPFVLYVLKRLLKNKKLIDAINEQAVDNIEDLYVNKWANTLDTTKEEQDKDLLNPFAMSTSERAFVPQYQNVKHMKMSEDELIKYLDEESDKEMRKRIRKR